MPTPSLRGEPKRRLQRALFGVYRHINERCGVADGYRDIKCEWPDYASFRDDMWESYVEHFLTHDGNRNTQIDRIDNDGNYSRDNCRWVTAAENSRNRSSNIVVEYQGARWCLRDLCHANGWSYKRTWKRLRVLKWSIDRIAQAEATHSLHA